MPSTVTDHAILSEPPEFSYAIYALFHPKVDVGWIGSYLTFFWVEVDRFVVQTVAIILNETLTYRPHVNAYCRIISLFMICVLFGVRVIAYLCYCVYCAQTTAFTARLHSLL